MVLDNTFTADRRVAPILACVYGSTAKEMPGDEIVVQPIEGFICT